MTTIEKMAEVLLAVLNSGTWFYSALEIDSNEQPYNGEQLEKLIKQALAAYEDEKGYADPYQRKRVFNHMAQEFDMNLTDGQLDDLINAVKDTYESESDEFVSVRRDRLKELILSALEKSYGYIPHDEIPDKTAETIQSLTETEQ